MKVQILASNNNMETLYLYVLLLALTWSIFNKYFITKLRNLPPTPWSAMTVIGYSTFLKKPLHQTLSKIATRHGPILLLRFGCRRVLLVSTAEAAEDLYTNNDLVFADRPKLLPAKEFGCDYTTLAWAPHGGLWRHLRRVSCLEILPFHRLPEQREAFGDEMKKLLRKLYCNKEDEVVLKPLFMDLVFNVMMRMFVGKSIFDRYCQKKTTEESVSLLEYASRSFKITTGESDVGYFFPILKLLGFTGLEQTCRKLHKVGDSIMNNMIEEIRNLQSSSESSYDHGSSHNDVKVIEILLEKQKQDPKLYSNEIIKGLVLELLAAGTDTSAGVLEWAFALLLNHPKVLRKAQKEIDNRVGNTRLLEQLDVDDLPYLRCIVKETMRLYPVAPLLVPHESSRDCIVGGYRVPKGTMLMMNAWAIQNNPRTWKDPERFFPERFEDIIDERDGFKLMPFGYGRRSCPGKHLAVRVITMALGSLVHCFDWETFGEGHKVEMTEETGLALFKDEPLKVVCRPRSMMNDVLSKV